MALADIIQAIKAQADREIAQIQQVTTRNKNTIRNTTDEELAAFEEDLRKKTEQQKVQLQKKAETQVQMERKKMLLREKRKALDYVYSAALKELQKLPAEQKKKIIDKLMKNVSGRDGKVQESKDGGFVFVSAKTEEDFTFPHLIHTMLRPKTEIDVSAKLFA
jgi:vacuolar-type H+-ATPase subunit E/Vma4